MSIDPPADNSVRRVVSALAPWDEPFVRELIGDSPRPAAVTDALIGALLDPPVGARPPPSIWARIATAARADGRFDRFIDVIGRLIDVSAREARQLLDSFFGEPRAPGPAPGSETLWVPGGPAVQGCVRGFLWLPAGAWFPHHEHLGEEQVLVMQGSYVDSSGRVVHAGELACRAPGTPHSLQATPDGPDLLLFNVIRVGVSLGPGVQLRHRDP